MSRTSVELAPFSTFVSNPSTQSLRDVLHEGPPQNETTIATEPASKEDVSKGTTAVVIASVTCVTAVSTLLAGLVTVGLPTMAKDVNLDPSLLLWPVSIYALTCGCTLLILGSVTDVVGSRIMYLIGCLLQSAFTLACGLSRTGTQLIVFRALAGVAISFCLPSAVSIITSTFPEGKRRNIAFASMGGGQPIGFSLGLTLGGVLSDSIGWRWGFYIAAIINTVIFGLAVYGLPRNIDSQEPITWTRLSSDIDWIGALISSASLAMLSYAFASITGNASNIRHAPTLLTLLTSLALIPLFIFWVGRQERLHRPAIIPNSLWRNRTFTSICLAVFLTWGAFNAVESMLTLFFQYVQRISPIQTSIRFLPAPVSGALSNIVMGLVVHRVRADWAVAAGTAIACVSPLLMALADPAWSYWAVEFVAVLLSPVGADVLFTISNLLITSVFPAKTQALAGGVFNTVAQIGKSVGLATSAVVASSVTARAGFVEEGERPRALMVGYRATFWYCFGLCLATLLVALVGLRKIGRVGVKRE
ncbi:uncharacterized protein BDZ99DRAFT_429276 [Mytilinidion resinicola]|uniref:Integral membrane protein n=1 Tax=Mytilinidion resinicola TaxID=574789 RepID=A0A6A6Y055_9PEZI|nr:uncharacterized protein BDZ99DRAFT_429276 [Mytilinidion resinicola]KAF2802029.1 integral membrane protein [Mytilinidion resinicola]